MAITPIDLQAIFSQVDKVGKAQTAAREGQALAQSIQGAQVQRKVEEQIKQVNEAQNTGEGVDKIKDQNQNQNAPSGNKQNKKSNENEKKEEAESKLILRDPSLGNKIDISL
jgi:hypothetical protein